MMKNILRQASVGLFPFVSGMFYRSKTEMKEGRRLLVFPLLKSLLLVKTVANVLATLWMVLE